MSLAVQVLRRVNPSLVSRHFTPRSLSSAASSYNPEVTQATNVVMGMLHDARERGYIGENVSQQEVCY